MVVVFEAIEGKKVLVTGASSGIGASISQLFAEHGAYVGLHFRSHKTRTTQILKKIRDKSGTAEIFQGDLLDQKTRNILIRKFAKQWGGIDILINNAGACYEYKHFSELNEKAWDKTVTLNTKVPFFLSRDAFKYMKEKKWGRIINISSVSVKYGGAKSLHYCCSKAALDALTTGFSREGFSHNILVNSIRCGVIDTPMHKNIKGYKEETFKKRIAMIPLKRMGHPIDIARMVLFLASECGDFITGEVFSVAGGE